MVKKALKKSLEDRSRYNTSQVAKEEQLLMRKQRELLQCQHLLLLYEQTLLQHQAFNLISRIDDARRVGQGHPKKELDEGKYSLKITPFGLSLH